MMRRRWLLGCVAIALGFARPAAAHPLDIGYLRIDANGRSLAVALDLHVHAAAQLIAVAPRALDARGLEHHAVALADATLRGAPITTPEGACRWTTATATLRDQTATLVGHAECPSPPRAIHWVFPFVRDARLAPAFQILVKARLAGGEHVALVDQTRPALELTGSPAIGWRAFAWSGVEHIGAAPSQWHGDDGWRLPDGIDHILFLIALMLAGGTILQILGIVTGFTLGHSITLALSALDIVRPPASLIEPMIALSIALVAARPLLGKAEHQRWTIAACFGLIHGFGFATALNELELATGDTIQALFGYNLGVELGQVAIVILTAPLLLYLQRRPRFRPLVRALAAVIFVAGISWFLERLG